MKIAHARIIAFLAVSGLQTQSIDGLWDATLKQGSTEIPFKLAYRTLAPK